MAKVIATSDFHGTLPEIPECDILIIAGDLCPDFPSKAGKYELVDKGGGMQAQWLDTTFRRWVNDLSAKRILAIWGNHDFVGERRALWEHLELPVRFLQDETVEVEGLRIHGTPWVPGLPRWAFHANSPALQARAEGIPRDLDILISHGPPYGVLDFVAPQFGSCHVGDTYLRHQLERIRPQVVVCGHIHEQYGSAYVEDKDGNYVTTVLNVSYNDENYNPINPPVEVVEIAYKEANV